MRCRHNYYKHIAWLCPSPHQTTNRLIRDMQWQCEFTFFPSEAAWRALKRTEKFKLTFGLQCCLVVITQMLSLPLPIHPLQRWATRRSRDALGAVVAWFVSQTPLVLERSRLGEKQAQRRETDDSTNSLANYQLSTSAAMREVCEPVGTQCFLLLTLMLERRSFLRTSRLMSLTATDSRCW